MFKGIAFAAGLWAALAGYPAAAEDRVDRNQRIMIEAARKLEFTGAFDGRAYMLLKREAGGSPVAVVFGYVDNAAACDEIAEALSNPLRVGTFKCAPIY